MLCISEISRYCIYHPQVEYARYNPSTGAPMGSTRRLFAQFQPGGGLPLWAQQLALKTFQFRGLPKEGVEPLETIGWWDSAIAAQDEAWTADELQQMEEFMRERNGDGFVIVERVAELPYPQWEKHRRIHASRRLEHVKRDVTAAYESAGFDLETAINWEMAHEADPEVLEFLRSLGDEEEPAAETTVAA